MTEEKKFSICLRIDSVTPAHTYFSVSIFSAMILKEYEHNQATRGKAGELCMRNEEVVPFIKHLAPHILMIKDDSLSEYFEGIKDELKLLYTTSIKTPESYFDPHKLMLKE